MKLVIGYLYGDLMNIYGDTGNIIALEKRCQWRGIEVKVENISIGDSIRKGNCDLFFFGGGQDESQIAVSKDLLNTNKNALRNEVERGIPLLAICGGYQLLGEYYQPQNGPKIAGLGLFPVFTQASNERMIGNLIIKTEEFGELVGFENHSGKTFINDKKFALGKVIKGFGNNGEDKTEGCIYNAVKEPRLSGAYKNAIGCYMHGSLLPKNPKLADWLIEKALAVKYGKKVEFNPLDDTLEIMAHEKVLERFS